MPGLRVYQHPRGGSGNVRHLPLGASQTYTAGDPVKQLDSQLVEPPQDASVVLVGECIGFAAEPATGILAGSRSITGQGAVENQIRSFYPLEDDGLMMATDNWWDTGVAGTQTGRPEGADIGDIFNLSQAAAATATDEWGVEDTAATAATEISCKILMVLDAGGNPIDADNTTTGVTAVFRVVDPVHQGNTAGA